MLIFFFPQVIAPTLSTPCISVSMQVSLCGMAKWFVGYLLEMLSAMMIFLDTWAPRIAPG